MDDLAVAHSVAHLGRQPRVGHRRVREPGRRRTVNQIEGIEPERLIRLWGKRCVGMPLQLPSAERAVGAGVGDVLLHGVIGAHGQKPTEDGSETALLLVRQPRMAYQEEVALEEDVDDPSLVLGCERLAEIEIELDADAAFQRSYRDHLRSPRNSFIDLAGCYDSAFRASSTGVWCGEPSRGTPGADHGRGRRHGPSRRIAL